MYHLQFAAPLVSIGTRSAADFYLSTLYSAVAVKEFTPEVVQGVPI